MTVAQLKTLLTKEHDNVVIKIETPYGDIYDIDFIHDREEFGLTVKGKEDSE